MAFAHTTSFNVSRCLLHSRSGIKVGKLPVKNFSSTAIKHAENSYKLVVVGGGCGGLAAASMFNKKLGKGNVAVIEPNEIHSYQPLWTLVGAGLKPFDQSQKPQAKLIPKGVDWIKDAAKSFEPEQNKIVTEGGREIQYQYMVVAMGLQLNFNQIKGAVAALESDPSVCSNYSEVYVKKTSPALHAFKGGNAIFTYPNSPVKCAGAPQKIMYLADEIFRNNKVRDQATIHYFTSLPAVFGIKKYADALMEVVNAKDIKLSTRTHLTEINHNEKTALFENIDSGETKSLQYEFMHVTPPMSTPDSLRQSPLVDPASGFVTVNRETLQHTEYHNVFAIGDNTNTPNAKTAAAVACQTSALRDNLSAAMEGKSKDTKYNGYASCPLVTSSKTCILAEFDWNGTPLETFPFDQGKESKLMYQLKANIMPAMYWDGLIKGIWHGPGAFRKVLNPLSK